MLNKNKIKKLQLSNLEFGNRIKLIDIIKKRKKEKLA